jgi:hypothetical protein
MTPSDIDAVSYRDLALEALSFVRINQRLLLVTAAVSLVAAVVVVHFLPLRYQASVMVAAQEGLSRSSSLGGLEDITGLAGSGALSSSSFQPLERFTQTLTNTTVAAEVIKKPWVLPTMFPREWDATSKTWHPPAGAGSEFRRIGNFLLGLPSWHPPGAQELSEKLNRYVNVSKFGRYPAYTVSFEWTNSTEATSILNLILKANDQIIQHDAQTRLRNTTAYLQKRLKAESDINRRTTLNQLLLEQERSLMAAEVNGPYAAKIIDRMSVVPTLTRKVIFGAATFFFIFAGLLIFAKLWRNPLQKIPAKKHSEA